MDNTNANAGNIDGTMNSNIPGEQAHTPETISTTGTTATAESGTGQNNVTGTPTSGVTEPTNTPVTDNPTETPEQDVSNQATENNVSVTEVTESEKPTEVIEDTPVIQESTEAVTTAPQPVNNQNGNWGIVAIILLVIAAVGAAFAVILLRKRKNKEAGKKTRYEEIAETVVQQNTPGTRIECGVAQTIGKREQQQDSLYCSNWKEPRVLMSRGLLAAVADGIGGLRDGHLASQGAMQAIRSAFLEGSSEGLPSDRLLTYAAAAQKSVLQLNQTSNCGATLVSVLITGKSMHFLSIGDSRIYLYRAGALLQLNREHILRRTNDEKEVFYGTGEKLTKKRAGALTSYLGKENLTLIDRSLQPMALLPGDRIALMSDGVFNTLSEREIMAHLRKNPEAAAQDMIRDVDAHANPAQDNASVVVIGIG